MTKLVTRDPASFTSKERGMIREALNRRADDIEKEAKRLRDLDYEALGSRLDNDAAHIRNELAPAFLDQPSFNLSVTPLEAAASPEAEPGAEEPAEEVESETCENCGRRKDDVVLRSGYDVPLCDECCRVLDVEPSAAPPAAEKDAPAGFADFPPAD